MSEWSAIRNQQAHGLSIRVLQKSSIIAKFYLRARDNTI